jgi:hypothetical protein
MVGEALHERGVAVLAGVSATHVCVYRKVTHRKVAFRHHALGFYFFDGHKLKKLALMLRLTDFFTCIEDAES